ncbi:nucleotidyltransferase domain-containing protein [Pseudothermotoga thermarum]|uniref:nucleotidyltransferase domain-containing protein n=1 Tax=Pseudothermotoga thermarum TaxID=119394 RepID=UPI0002E66531|nr:nucleotidyltransferase domain-containing protein [Pseudothermotoga thermarum]
MLEWAKTIVEKRNDIVKIGYFGSYARGDWGVGSDLDVVIIVKDSKLPFEKRAVEFDTTQMVVPVDLVVYTQLEFEKMKASGSSFIKMIEKEVQWVYR